MMEAFKIASVDLYPSCCCRNISARVGSRKKFNDVVRYFNSTQRSGVQIPRPVDFKAVQTFTKDVKVKKAEGNEMEPFKRCES